MPIRLASELGGHWADVAPPGVPRGPPTIGKKLSICRASKRMTGKHAEGHSNRQWFPMPVLISDSVKRQYDSHHLEDRAGFLASVLQNKRAQCVNWRHGQTHKGTITRVLVDSLTASLSQLSDTRRHERTLALTQCRNIEPAILKNAASELRLVILLHYYLTLTAPSLCIAHSA